jgi:hypothetical protein
VKTDPPSHQRFFRFSYLRPYSAGLPHIHELRDGDAFAELAVVLAAAGLEYGGLVLNYLGAPLSLDSAKIGPSDLIILTTRPPLDDDRELHRLFIERTDSELEKMILAALRRFFRICSRPRIMLTEEFASQLKQKNRGNIVFRVHGPGPACYSELRVPYSNAKQSKPVYKGPAKTAAYFIRTRIGDDGPTLMAAFSLDGPETLTWCYLLRTAFPKLLTSDRFVMAEITFSSFPERPNTLSFAKQFTVELLLNQPL